MAKIFEPYDYQLEGINEIRRAFARGHRRVLYQLATGGGKTAVFGFIARAVSERRKNTWVIAHRDNLVRQASRSLGDLGVSHGIIARTNAFQPYETQVCSVQTLVKRFDKIPMEPYLIVIDEAHHCAGKNTWTAVLDRYPNALVLGVTATPERLDGTGLDSVFDIMIQGPPMEELIRRKRIVPLEIYEPVKVSDENLKRVAGDVSKKASGELMEKGHIIGQAVEKYKKICYGARTLVFCPTISVAVKIVEQFNASKIPSAVVHGKMSAEEQWNLIQSLAQKRILILATVDVVAEGTDIPAVEAGIMMRHTDSLVVYMQQAGRIMRTADGKTHGYLLDMVGNVDKHLPPEFPREWSLAGSRVKGKRKSEPSLNLYRCGKCFLKYKPHLDKCPKCGTPKDTSGNDYKEVEGELVLMDEKRKKELEARALAEKKQKKVAQQKAQTLADLYLLSIERNYNGFKWAEKMYLARKRKELEKRHDQMMMDFQRGFIEEEPEEIDPREYIITAEEKRIAMKEAYRRHENAK